MTFAEYHQTEGVSNTMLGYLANGTPAHLQHYLTHEKVSTRAQRFGSMFHSLMQHEQLPDCYAVRPEGMDGRTKEGRAWRAELAGRIEVSFEQAYAARAMRGSVLLNPRLRAAIETGTRETALFSEFSLETGAAPSPTVKRKGLLDVITKAAAILDFKTTTDASRDAFSKALVNLGYARQAAYYLDLASENGLANDQFGFVVVEKEPPFAVALYQVEPDAIAWGRKQYVRLLAKYIECKQSGEWPGYGDEPIPISIPQWAMKREEAE